MHSYAVGMADMLSLAAHLPAVEYAAGDVVIQEGTTTGSIWVLVSGSLEIRKGAVAVNSVVHAGSLLGEVAVLLGHGHSASVVAAEPSVLRYAKDGRALLDSDPQISTYVAVGLAERLDFVTTYLADLKAQYSDAPGLAMVSDVLAKLAARTGPTARPGSAREPDPEY